MGFRKSLDKLPTLGSFGSQPSAAWARGRVGNARLGLSLAQVRAGFGPWLSLVEGAATGRAILSTGLAN
ncbi:hypothetical protein MesoLjLc_42530 [Mesorhizobium sp. L-8-10]|nr:hypothetical protein MesoLjLc_42530 [Mesorhizobium sp. L-8-10]